MLSVICTMIAIINMITLLWVLWILGSFSPVVEASILSSSVALESNGNEAIHSIENLLSSHKAHKGYEESLALINSLNLPHSCLYSSLTESIIAKCSSAPSVLDGEEKNFFATKLAICELSSANIDYPRDCRVNIQSSKDLNRCIKKLESRPQWWTSWSNCIQSVGVLCQAVREEAERENLLRLHRNLTVLHQQLEIRLSNSIKLHSNHLQQASKSSKMVHSRLAVLIGEMDALLNDTVVPLDDYLKGIKQMIASIDRQQLAYTASLSEQNAALDKQARTHKETLHQVEGVIRGLAQTMETLERKLYDRYKLDEESRMENLEKMSIAVKTTTLDTIENIKRSIKSLQGLTSETGVSLNSLMDSILHGQAALNNLANGFDSLSNSHERISRSMLSQEETANRQLDSVTFHATIFNNTFRIAIDQSSELLEKLTNMHTEFHQRPQNAMDAVPGLALISTYLPILISILVVLDRKRSALAIISFAAIYTFLITYPFAIGLEESDNDRFGDQVGAKGLLLDAGSHQYRWLQDCATMFRGYIRTFW